jgi:hypothetical protein
MQVPRLPFLVLICVLSAHVAAWTADTGSTATAATNPWSLKATLSAPGSPLEFGYAVALSGNTVVTTANTAIDVYVQPKTGWGNMTSPTAKLTTSDGVFLNSVAIDGDTVVAGSIQTGGTGAAYVFVKPSKGWSNMTETAKLTASDAFSGSYVGMSVTVAGSTIVVGADENDSVGATFPAGGGPGAVYVYVKPSAGWSNTTETAKLTASDGVSGDDLGYQVAIEGNSIAASAPNATIGSTTLEGAVYIFQNNGSGWKNATQVAKLTASDGHEVTVLGLGLSINGNTLAAAAFDKVYVFLKPSSGWTTKTQAAELSSTAYTFYGLNSVAVYNNVVLAGSPHESSPFADLYVEPSGVWQNMRPSYRLKAPTGNGNGADGFSVAMNATTLVVGSPLLSGNGGNVVFVYGK